MAGDHVLTIDARLGRKMSEDMVRRGAPLVRLKAKDVAVVGVERVPGSRL